jgi:hypothetical protein
MTYKTPEQLANDRRHKRRLLPTNTATPRRDQGIVIEKAKTAKLPLWGK